jgi:GTP-binding protein Era
MEGREIDVARVLSGLSDEVPEGHRAGLVAVVGRPNVGKSTLLNRLLGEKVAIVTAVPGTTRSTVRGVVTRPDAQIVVLDTPGLTRPRTLLARRLNQLVRDTWSTADVVVFMVDVAGGIGTGDAFLAKELAALDVPVVAVPNKVDRVRPRELLIPELVRLEGLMGPEASFADIVPLSAATGENLETLIDVIVAHLPISPRLASPDEVTDQPERVLASEVVREKVMRGLGDELPHSVAVTVDEIVPDERRADLVRIDAVIHVERESQKAIVIGAKGERLKDAATAARKELETLLGVKVHLTTHVTVAKEWQRDPRQLGRLGY